MTRPRPMQDKDPKDFDKEYWKDKECYRCAKKGHPATACLVKPPSNEDDNSKSSKASSKSSKDMLKRVWEMGKALTQLGETVEEFDDDLFEELSHAQLGEVVIPDGYSFGWGNTG